MKTTRLVAAAFCAAGLSIAPGASADALITNFNKDNVEQALQGIGATNIQYTKDNEGDSTSFTHGGLNYVAFYHVCPPERGCLGLNMTVAFDAGATPYSAALANGFNIHRVFATAVVFPSGRLQLNRYVIADHGITQANLTENLRVFVGMPEQLKQYLQERPVASRPGSPTPATGAIATMAAPAANAHLLAEPEATKAQNKPLLQ